MKVTVAPGKFVHKAVAWYAKHISPKGVDACVETIGENYVHILVLYQKVYCGDISVTPVTLGNPVASYGLPILYTEYVIDGPSEEKILQFLDDAKKSYETRCNTFDKNSDTLNIMTWDGGAWCDEYKTPRRSKNSIYVPEFQVVIDDLNNFYAQKDRYLSLEIPYARTYMFHGLPGTGKTSMIYTIASELNKNVAIIDFSDAELSDRHIRRALYKLPPDTILCLEDIDSLFSENRKSDKSTITFSGILNILDGVVKNTGIVIIMTTNLLKDLDDAAMRRRVDYYLKFDFMKREQMTKMFSRFYPDQDPDKFTLLVEKLKLTPCVLQKFFVKHLDTDDISQHVEELFQMCNNEYKIIKDPNSMYF
jgi:hypothetical protein